MLRRPRNCDWEIRQFAQQYFEELAGSLKPRYARETEAVYRRYIADAFATRAVASITAADTRRFRADLVGPRPKRSYRPRRAGGDGYVGEDG
ncbi:hypothetical protein [Rhodococcoides kyotonense]|uniref:hypothetical protein n=1 Tax=Rhodococcoides kyotonense TaxID=398843 RepID=UPI000B783D96